jgi:hypothetical protein
MFGWIADAVLKPLILEVWLNNMVASRDIKVMGIMIAGTLTWYCFNNNSINSV